MQTEDLRLFCLVAELRSFTAASETAGIPKSTVSKAVRRLEDGLGVRLLERSTRRVRVTEAGGALLARARGLLELAEGLEDEIRGYRDVLHGELRIAAPLDLGAHVARHLIPEFTRLHPRLNVSLVLSYEFSDFFAEEIDLALRVGPLPTSGLFAQRVGTFSSSLYAHPELLRRSGGEPRSPSELTRLPLLGFRDSSRIAQEWVLGRGKERVKVPVEGPVSVENFRALFELCTAGVGVARLPDLFYATPAAEQGLQRVLPHWKFSSAEVNAVYPSRKLRPRKVDVFLAYLKTRQGLRGA
jgi:DNA-binding transcriptional LysR family regulator